MFVPSEPITEIIAHFIGVFSVQVEEMRMRHVYEEFYHRTGTPAQPELPQQPTDFQAHLALRDFAPHVRYVPPQTEGDLDLTVGHFRHPLSVEFHAHVPVEHHFVQYPSFGVAQSEPVAPMFAPPPGSTVLVVQQTMVLVDNDVIISGDIAVDQAQALGDGGALNTMLQLAQDAAGPIAAIEAPHVMSTIAPYFEAVHGAIQSIAASQGSDGTVLTVTHTSVTEAGFTAETTTMTGPAITGVYLDGVAQDSMPKLSDVLPQHLQGEAIGGAAIEVSATNTDADADANDAPSAPLPDGTVSDAVVTIDPSSMGTSMTVDAGGNLMVNEVALVNAGLTGTFMAVGGDYHAINAIIQTNIYADHDMVDPGFPGAGTPSSGAATQAHNVASFSDQSVDNAANQAALNPGVFPTNWTVSVVNGDIAFVDWVQQYNFMTDSDTHVLTATGTTTTISTGENIGINNVSFTDIGKYFDVILVQGNLYDGNVITQTNVLYDNDVVTWLNGAGPSPSDTGSVSTGDNLLWNSAAITNIGMGDIQSGLPDAYADAMAQLGSSHYDMPGSLGDYNAFEGFANLRVLYVTGNLYDLHTINQVNVMGDADLVAAYHQDVVANALGDHWTVNTGANVLANVASIIDYDSMGTTAHVAGSIYSDAVLIQSNLVDATAPELPGHDQLANEIIAFLDIDMDSIASDHAGPALSLSDLPSGDALHTMLG